MPHGLDELLLEAAMAWLGAATQVLPLSGTGHVALATLLVGDPPPVTLLPVVLAAVTVALAIALRKRLAKVVVDGVLARLRRGRVAVVTQGTEDAVSLVVAGVVGGAVAVALRHHVVAWGDDPAFVGAGLLVSAAALASTGWAHAGTRRDLPWVGAVLVGAAHGASVIPGISGTALALATLLWLGLPAEAAFELCFLLAIPAGGVSCGFALGSLHVHGPGLIAPVILLAAPATGVALGAFFLARKLAAGKATHWLALYLFPLAVASIAWGYARP